MERKWNEMKGKKYNEMKWHGIKWNGIKWNEMEWNEMQWNGAPTSGYCCCCCDSSFSTKRLRHPACPPACCCCSSCRAGPTKLALRLRWVFKDYFSRHSNIGQHRTLIVTTCANYVQVNAQPSYVNPTTLEISFHVGQGWNANWN